MGKAEMKKDLPEIVAAHGVDYVATASVADYLKQQKRYRHLFASEQGRAEIEKLQAIANRNIEKYGLMNGT